MYGGGGKDVEKEGVCRRQRNKSDGQIPRGGRAICRRDVNEPGADSDEGTDLRTRRIAICWWGTTLRQSRHLWHLVIFHTPWDATLVPSQTGPSLLIASARSRRLFDLSSSP